MPIAYRLIIDVQSAAENDKDRFNMWEINLRSLFLKLLIASVAISAAFGIIVILFGDFGSFELRVLMTTLTVTVTSILGLACGACIEAGRGNLLPKAGIAFSLVSAAMLMLIIWDVLDDSEIYIKTTMTFVIGAIVASHLSLLSIARLDQRFQWSLGLAWVCDLLLAGIILFVMWTEIETQGDLVSRIMGVLSILIAAVTVVTPVFHRLSSGTVRTGETIDEEIARLREHIVFLEAEKAELEEPE